MLTSFSFVNRKVATLCDRAHEVPCMKRLDCQHNAGIGASRELKCTKGESGTQLLCLIVMQQCINPESDEGSVSLRMRDNSLQLVIQACSDEISSICIYMGKVFIWLVIQASLDAIIGRDAMRKLLKKMSIHCSCLLAHIPLLKVDFFRFF